MNEELERVEKETPECAEFVPSPTWKRVVAWVLFAIVVLGIITWLLNIACPGWIEAVKAKLL